MVADKSTFGLGMVTLDRRVGSLRLQLADQLRAAIRDGRLETGVRLPSTRRLAVQLGVSRGVATDVYAVLAAEGWIAPTRNARPIVRSVAPLDSPAHAKASWRFDLTPNAPDLISFPRTAWLAATRRALASAIPAELGYGDPAGPLRARVTLAGYLGRSRAAAVSAEQIVVTSGYTQALALICRALAAQGVRSIAVEDPSLDDAWGTIRQAGLEIVAVGVDEQGIDTRALAALDVAAVLVTPAHQYPTGVRLSPARRRALVQWAQTRSALIIEDDYDGEHVDPHAGVGVLQALAPDRIVLIGSASKTLAPALRIGWLHAPAALASAIERERWFADSGPPALTTLAFAEFIERGDLGKHLRRSRTANRSRRDALIAALAETRLGPAAGQVIAGPHLCIELPTHVDDRTVTDRLATQRINVRALSTYRLAHPGPPGLVLGYSQIHEDSALLVARMIATAI